MTPAKIAPSELSLLDMELPILKLSSAGMELNKGNLPKVTFALVVVTRRASLNKM